MRGVDLSSAMVRRAEQKLPAELRERVRFATGDAAALPDPDASFDLVVLLNLPAYFAEVARVVRPGGAVIVASSLGPTTPYFTPELVLTSEPHTAERWFGRLR